MKHRSRITIAQTQRLSLNVSLMSAISLLKSDAGTISAWLEEKAAQNPLLALTPPPAVPAVWAPRWHDALSRQANAPVEALPGPAPGLQAGIASAMSGLRLSAAEIPAARALLAALEPTGWLGSPLAVVAREAGLPVALLESVLALLQQLEPTGIFARDLAECLRLQAIEAEEHDPVMAVILTHLPLVASNNLSALARKAGADEAAIALRIRRLRRYDPKPGARFQPGAAPVAEPDLLLRPGPAGPELSFNHSSLPSLRLAEGASGDRRAAQEVIRLVEARNHTLLRIGAEILRRQPDIVRQGLAALVPMTMSEIAAALGLHQSTVSRMVQGTSLDSGTGTFWLRAMFSPAVRKGGPTSAAVRDAMAQMIAAEDPACPLDDAALAEALTGAGVPLSRRTIAKYREDLGIPIASRRKQAKKRPSATLRGLEKVAPGDDPALSPR